VSASEGSASRWTSAASATPTANLIVGPIDSLPAPLAEAFALALALEMLSTCVPRNAIPARSVNPAFTAACRSASMVRDPDRPTWAKTVML